MTTININPELQTYIEARAKLPENRRTDGSVNFDFLQADIHLDYKIGEGDEADYNNLEIENAMQRHCEMHDDYPT